MCFAVVDLTGAPGLATIRADLGPLGGPLGGGGVWGVSSREAPINRMNFGVKFMMLEASMQLQWMLGSWSPGGVATS